jgi:hypothetical protein
VSVCRMSYVVCRMSYAVCRCWYLADLAAFPIFNTFTMSLTSQACQSRQPCLCRSATWDKSQVRSPSPAAALFPTAPAPAGWGRFHVAMSRASVLALGRFARPKGCFVGGLGRQSQPSIGVFEKLLFVLARHPIRKVCALPRPLEIPADRHDPCSATRPKGLKHAAKACARPPAVFRPTQNG